MPPRKSKPTPRKKRNPSDTHARWQTMDVIALDAYGNPKENPGPGFVKPPSPERWAKMQEEWRAMDIYVVYGDPQPAIDAGVLPKGTPRKKPA